MRSTRTSTAARTAAVVLSTLCALAVFNTAVVIRYAVEHDAGAGLVAASAVSVGVCALLGYAAARMWRRGSGD